MMRLNANSIQVPTSPKHRLGSVVSAFAPSRSRFGLFLVPNVSVVAFVLFVGCTRQSPSVNNTADSNGDAANQNAARQLLDDVVATYAQASQYHDDAKIVVRYRLEGRPMEEHQLWAIDFKRPGQLAARLFNARIQSDQNRTTAMVFDFDSENMDSQFLVLGPSSGPPWKEMFSDPVCRHFICGSSEIPFNSRLANELILPPTIGLLLGQPTVDWISNPDKLEMLADDEMEGKSVRRLRIERERRKYELWIDSESKLLVQVILPNQFLDAALLISPEITKLQLSVQFNAATLRPNWAQSPFSTELPDNANPVSRFVPLPDPFPSECIGKPIPTIALTDASSQPKNWSPPQTTTVLAWVDRQENSLELIRQLETIVAKSGEPPINVQLCFVEFPDPNPQAKKISELPQYVHDAGIRFPIASDMGLSAGQILGVKFAPTVIVFDASGKVQFFHAIALADWKAKLSGAIDRIAKGDNLAGEMRAEYSKFVDEYKNNLQRLNPLAQNAHTPAQTVARHSSSNPKQPSQALWTIAELKRPGNILQLSSNRILVNDGWQSVAELDLTTQMVVHHKLDLESEMSVTIMRADRVGETSRIAAFAEMGRQVLVIGDDCTTIGKCTSESPTQIRDVQIDDWDGDGTSDYWILDSNSILVRFDETLRTKIDQVQLDSAESFIAIPGVDHGLIQKPVESPIRTTESFPLPGLPGRGQGEGAFDDPARFLVVRADGGLVMISDKLQPQPPFTFGSLKVKRLLASPSAELLACATALSEQGDWVAVGINHNLEVAWTHAIGPQEFDRQIQPIASLAIDKQHSLWAFAASDNTITILSDDGRVVDSLKWPSDLHGLALSQLEGAPALIVSDSKQLSATMFSATAAESNESQ